MSEDLNAPNGTEWSSLTERFVVTGPSATPGYVNVDVYSLGTGTLIRLTIAPAKYVRQYVLDH